MGPAENGSSSRHSVTIAVSAVCPPGADASVTTLPRGVVPQGSSVASPSNAVYLRPVWGPSM